MEFTQFSLSMLVNWDVYSGTSLLLGQKNFFIREVSLFQRLILLKYTIGTSETVLIREESLFQRCPLREVPLVHT